MLGVTEGENFTADLNSAGIPDLSARRDARRWRGCGVAWLNRWGGEWVENKPATLLREHLETRWGDAAVNQMA
jgi:hypothetical protein